MIEHAALLRFSSLAVDHRGCQASVAGFKALRYSWEGQSSAVQPFLLHPLCFRPSSGGLCPLSSGPHLSSEFLFPSVPTLTFKLSSLNRDKESLHGLLEKITASK